MYIFTTVTNGEKLYCCSTKAETGQDTVAFRRKEYKRGCWHMPKDLFIVPPGAEQVVLDWLREVYAPANIESEEYNA